MDVIGDRQAVGTQEPDLDIAFKSFEFGEGLEVLGVDSCFARTGANVLGGRTKDLKSFGFHKKCTDRIGVQREHLIADVEADGAHGLRAWETRIGSAKPF